MDSEKRRLSRRHRQDNEKIQRNITLVKSGYKNKKVNRFGRTLGLIGLFVLMIAVGWGVHAYMSLNSTVNKMNGSTNTATSVRIATRQPISVLVLGVDQGIEGRHDRGNSDTIILATANPAKKTATMTSIPRDTLTEIKGETGSTQYFMFKVNSAYEFGGHNGSVKTVSAMLNVPVQYYVEVNMKALKSLVDGLGGVDVDVPFSFSYDWCDFRKGRQHLNGRHAVAYARMRYDDPRGDYGRQARQRQIIQAILTKAMSIKGLANYQKLLKVFAKYVKTNLTFGDMTALALNYRGAAKNLKSGYLHGHDATISDTSFQIASTSQLQKVSDRIRKNLGLSTETVNNQETRQNSLNEKYNKIDFSDENAFTNYTIYDADSDTPRSSDSW